MKPKTIKEALKGKLLDEELEKVCRSYDRIGDIIIVEIPEGLESKEKEIGKVILSTIPNIKTVCKKVGIHYGKYRLQKLRILAGARNKTGLHKESGTVLRINYEKTYFSPRLSNERIRVASQVANGEDVLVMFSGAGPYPCVIGKNKNPASITGVELNPKAHELALENVKLNKLDNITLICGDAAKVVPTLKKKFDRIIMPLPKSADDFMQPALHASKKGCKIHVYLFAHENEYDQTKSDLKELCKKHCYNVKVIELVPCGQHKPRVYRVCVDLEVLN